MQGKKIQNWLGAIFVFLALFTTGDGLAEPLDQWHWRNPWLQGNSLGVSYGNGIFVAVGEFGAIYTSADGATWTSRTSGTDHWLSDAAYGSGTFVAVGGGGTVLTSPDGITWTSQLPGIGYNLNGVAYGSDMFAAVGDNGVIVTSPNGAAWAVRESGTQQALKKVAFGHNTFVAVGMNGIILTSPNGAIWTGETAGTSGHLKGIAYGNSTFVAVGEAILTSPDGISWTEGGPKTNRHFSGIAYGSGTFVAVADNGHFFTSPDGAVWTQRNAGAHSSLLAIAYGDGSFVAAAENGTFLQSDSLPSPRISVFPTSLDFGSVNVANSSSKTLTITNSGSAGLVIQRLAISGTDTIDFITQNDLCTGTTVAPSENCSLEIVFSPHTLGSKSATLSISSNDSATPTQTVSLKGGSSGVSSSTNGSFCFISSLADGSGLERYIDIFRKFRDVFLLESRLGKTLADFYYHLSPSLVNFFARHDFLREVLRWGLVPLAAFSYVALHTSPAEKAILVFLMNGGVIAGFFFRRHTKFGKFSNPLSTNRPVRFPGTNPSGFEGCCRLTVSYCSQIEIGAIAKISAHGKSVKKGISGQKLHLLHFSQGLLYVLLITGRNDVARFNE